MAGVQFCKSEISHPFTLTTVRTNSLMTQFLLPQDIHIKDRDGNSTLHLAAALGDANFLQMLLNAGAAINDRRTDGCTPLHLAVKSGQEENVRILLSYGARVDLKDLFGKTPIHLISCLDYQDVEKVLRIAKLILDRGANMKVHFQILSNLC